MWQIASKKKQLSRTFKTQASALLLFQVLSSDGIRHLHYVCAASFMRRIALPKQDSKLLVKRAHLPSPRLQNGNCHHSLARRSQRCYLVTTVKDS